MIIEPIQQIPIYFLKSNNYKIEKRTLDQKLGTGLLTLQYLLIYTPVPISWYCSTTYHALKVVLRYFTSPKTIHWFGCDKALSNL